MNAFEYGMVSSFRAFENFGFRFSLPVILFPRLLVFHISSLCFIALVNHNLSQKLNALDVTVDLTS